MTNKKACINCVHYARSWNGNDYDEWCGLDYTIWDKDRGFKDSIDDPNCDFCLNFIAYSEKNMKEMELNEIINSIKEKYRNHNKKINEENLKSFINGFLKWESGTFNAKQIDVAIFEFIDMCESFGRPLLDLFINITNKEINWNGLGLPFSKIDIVNFVDDNLIHVCGYYECIEGKNIFEDCPMISINYDLMDKIYYAIQYRLNDVLFGD